MIQILSGFPFQDQVETVIVFDILEDLTDQTPLSFSVGSIIDKRVCITSVRFSTSAFMVILTMITKTLLSAKTTHVP
jgi:hypothetical protein